MIRIKVLVDAEASSPMGPEYSWRPGEAPVRRAVIENGLLKFDRR